MSYDFEKDNAAIVLDRSNNALDPELPYVVYKNGEHLGSFKDYQGGVAFAAGLDILGECTVRDAFAPSPVIPLADADVGIHSTSRRSVLSPILQVINGGRGEDAAASTETYPQSAAFKQLVDAVRETVAALEARPEWSKTLSEKNLQRGLRAALDNYERGAKQ